MGSEMCIRDRVPGVHRVGPPAPGGHMGCRGCALAYMGQGHQPQEAHAPREEKKERVLKGEGTSEVPWGGWTPPPFGRTLPWRKGQGLRLPLSLGPIYSGGRAATSTALGASLLPCNTSLSLAEARRSPAGDPLHPPPRRRAAGSPSTSPSPLLDQEGGDVAAPYVC